MTTQCSSTASSITEILLAGDAVLNLTAQPLNAVAGTLFVEASGDQLRLSPFGGSVVWRSSFRSALPAVVAGDVARLVVISDEDSSDAESVARDLCALGIPHLHCTLVNTCEADAFMDQEDTQAVTERLRQLGYI